jgi:hypothetical protein
MLGIFRRCRQSVNAKVALLVEDDVTLYTMCQRKGRISHLLKIRRAFRRSVPFLKIFEEPTSVDVIIVLLVGDDLTLYMMVIIVPKKR